MRKHGVRGFRLLAPLNSKSPSNLSAFGACAEFEYLKIIQEKLGLRLLLHDLKGWGKDNKKLHGDAFGLSRRKISSAAKLVRNNRLV